MRKSAPQLLCLALVLFLFSTNTYRAATQSITADEAFTYNNFVWPSLVQSFSTFDANNHLLHTLLSKLSVRWFGLSEFGLRVPSLMGGLLFLVSAWRLARRVFGRGWFCLFALTAVTLNPFVLDYLSAARGYGLALGLFFWGLFLLARYLAEDYDPPVRLLFRAGLALGLSVIANLVFLVPVAAAAGVFSLIAVLSPNPARFQDRFWGVVDRFWGPALVPPFVALILPLTKAGLKDFYYGAKSLEEMAHNLVVPSLMHKPGVWELRRYLPHFDSWPGVAVRIVIPALSLVILLVAARAAVRWIRARDIRALSAVERSLLLVAGTLALSFAAIVAAHARSGVLYPLRRTALYWPPLFTLASVAAIAILWRARIPGKMIAAAGAAIVALAIGLFAAGFTTDHYAEWRYDAGTKRIVNMLRELHRNQPGARVQLGVNWLFEPALNFYRHRYHLDWIEPVTRAGPDGDYDYYVLLPKDAPAMEKMHLRPLYRDPVSEATLAAPARRSSPVD